jgi:hypothetical protein
VTLRHYPDRNAQMEIAGVLIIQGKNRYGGAFFVGRVDHGMTQAIPSADARMMCRGRHTSECSEPVKDRRVLALVVHGKGHKLRAFMYVELAEQACWRISIADPRPFAEPSSQASSDIFFP